MAVDVLTGAEMGGEFISSAGNSSGSGKGLYEFSGTAVGGVEGGEVAVDAEGD